MTHPPLLVDEIVRDVLAYAGQLGADASSIDESDDLYDAGLTSHTSVLVMVALEDALGVEFPEHLLRKSTFTSISAIKTAVAQIEEVAR